MVGISEDGGYLSGWPHVQQSIRICLTTVKWSRVMRRDFFSDLPNMIDAPMNARNIMALFAVAAVALEPRLVDGSWYGVPQFRLSQVEIDAVSHTGSVVMRCFGTYYPNGHKNDLSRAEDVVTDVAIGML